MALKLVFVFAGILLASAYGVSYKGYHTLLVGPIGTIAQLKKLETLRVYEENRQIIFSHDHPNPENGQMEIIVHPKLMNLVSAKLRASGIDYNVIDVDFQKVIDRANSKNKIAKEKYLKAKASGVRTPPTAYLRHSEINSWLTSTANAHSRAATFSLGRTHEGREMLGIAINGQSSSLPAIWLDSNVHAREWISSASALWIIDEILNGADADLRTNYRWFIVPMANPDGYEYSHTTDRLWRKSRYTIPGATCKGTDNNRNFDFNWGVHGTSTSPCSDTYGGSAPFSDPDAVLIRDAVLQRRNGAFLYISLHSYSQLWLVNWAGQLTKPSDYGELKAAGDVAAIAVQAVNGRRFEVGTPPDILYAASGGMMDWAKQSAGIKFSYTPELRPATSIEGGFVLGPEHIAPSGAEIFAGVRAIVQSVGKTATK